MCKNKQLIIIMIIFSIFTTAPAYIYSEALPEMRVHFIDVGQGDSILIQTPSKKTILIDGGPPKAGKKVVSFLESKQIKTIDLLIATHPDIDHIGGLPQVMKSVKVKQILDSGKLHSTKTYARYINQIYKQDIPIKIAKKNEHITVDSMLKIKVLNTYEKNKSNNQSSIVLKISFKEIDMLLMSDVEIEQEKSLLESQDLQSEIIKVAHHGSNTSTSLGFLQEVNPQIAILTYSKENDFGHPVDRVVENLYKVNATIYSTAAFGNVEIRTNGMDYFVIPQRDPINNLEDNAG
ncbi:competence protein [Virgibacillus profundi]|uniref:Competence protein n=1 Tax=Virgibacillus profundi TaxID=2024555 RepID=A0A2A2I908_9BACI|nr:MBL fold metallo-hydrolase [Virgibacillus profundi]PAV28117.1 competence protein [Virgibacillus profundi]PXY52422.1 MBL fold metallo-hydrolase [Virgibacillus profundi]